MVPSIPPIPGSICLYKLPVLLFFPRRNLFPFRWCGLTLQKGHSVILYSTSKGLTVLLWPFCWKEGPHHGRKPGLTFLGMGCKGGDPAITTKAHTCSWDHMGPASSQSTHQLTMATSVMSIKICISHHSEPSPCCRIMRINGYFKSLHFGIEN